MLVSWGVLMPLGAASSRSRRILDRIKPGMWFIVHRGLNAAGFVIAVAGGAIAMNDYSQQNRTMTKHGMMGFVVMSLAVLQIGAALLRPDKEAPSRVRWHAAHAVVGSVAVALGLLQCIFGSMLLNDREGEPVIAYIVPALVSAVLAIALT